MHLRMCLFVVIKVLLADKEAKPNVTQAEAEIREATAKLAKSEAKVAEAEAKVAESEAEVRNGKAKVAEAEAKINQYPVSQSWINELKERWEALKTAYDTLKRREEAHNETQKRRGYYIPGRQVGRMNC